jgi:ribosome biogenesis protein SSF1/2
MSSKYGKSRSEGGTGRKIRSHSQHVAMKKNEIREKQREKEESEALTVPRSIIYASNRIGYSCENMEDCLKLTMMPYTAKNLEITKKQKTEEIVDFANKMAVSHLVKLSQTEKGTIMKICKLPRGPTVSFSLHEYCDDKDVQKFLKSNGQQYSSIDISTPAVVVLNNFNNNHSPNVKLAAASLQNMFPAVDVTRFKEEKVRRVVLFHLDQDESIQMRQYTIKVEKTPEGKKVKLVEVGPRMTLRVLKILEGVFNGDTIYHKFIKKTPDEVEFAKRKRQQLETEKARRRQEQDENVKRKRDDKDKKKSQNDEKLTKIRTEGHKRMEDNVEKELQEEDDDAEYYRQAVGEDAPEELELPTKKKVKQ